MQLTCMQYFSAVIQRSKCLVSLVNICFYTFPGVPAPGEIFTSHWLQCPGNTFPQFAHWPSRLAVGRFAYPHDVITPVTIWPLTCGALHEWGLFQGLPRGPLSMSGQGHPLAASDLFLGTQRDSSYRLQCHDLEFLSCFVSYFEVLVSSDCLPGS